MVFLFLVFSQHMCRTIASLIIVLLCCKAFEGYTKAVQERDVLVYVLRKNKVFDLDGLIVNWTGKTVPYSSFKGIVLIGKDGSIKLKKPFLVSAKEIFDLIDSMPMRRAEMKDSVKD